MQARHPHGGLCGDLRCHCGKRLSARPIPGLRTVHRYQPSIQMVICSVAFAMCFSTVLTLNPCRCAISW